MTSPGKATLIFFLSSFKGFNTGIGGHYRSVNELSRALSADFNVHVITFGDIPSPVFLDTEGYVHAPTKSPLDPLALRKLRKQISAIVACSESGEPVRIVSVGLNNDYAPMRLATLGLSLNYYHIKPGGKPPLAPSVFNGIPLAVFHESDLETFTKADPPRDVVMTPGRVSAPAFDPAFLEEARSPVYDDDSINIACVMRISSYYRDSILSVHQALREIEGITFTHYGAIQDKALHTEIAGAPLEIPYALVTSESVTSAAAKALYPFQAFIGFGRSALEAMSLGIPVFIPVPTSGGPQLHAVTKENWRIFARANFTARVSHEDLCRSGPVVGLKSVARSNERLTSLGRDVHKIFQRNFSTASSRETLINFLARSSYGGGARDALRIALLFRSEIKRASILRRSTSESRATR